MESYGLGLTGLFKDCTAYRKESSITVQPDEELGIGVPCLQQPSYDESQDCAWIICDRLTTIVMQCQACKTFGIVRIS